MSIAMDPPSAQNPAQQGVLNVRDFTIHDEAQLQRAVTTNGQQQNRRNEMMFSGMRVEFTRMPGRVGLREGVVRGPLLGGTIDGVVDYARDEMHMRGTLVPLYGPNNLLGQMPLVGLFLGGEKEGLVGITYEVVGPARQSGAAHQPDLGAGAGTVAQGVRIPGDEPRRRRTRTAELPGEPPPAASLDTAERGSPPE